MITSRAWAGKRYAVLGLARSGAATVAALLAGGARVVAWDSDATKRTQILPVHGEGDQPQAGGGGGEPGTAAGSSLPTPSTTGLRPAVPLPMNGEDLVVADLDTLDLSTFDALVVSPGVPLNRHPLAAKARAAGVPVIGDIELFAQARAELPPHKVVGITGTNGKSTTTALVHHMLQTAGVPSLMAGNIGLPILSRDPLPAGGVYVLELSSYQIDLTQSLDCNVAVLLNITPDHLDRYRDFEDYAAAKARLFTMQAREHRAIISIADTPSALIARALSAKGEQLIKIAPGFCMDQSRWPRLQGPHNAQNALAAINVAEALGVPNPAIDRALESFAGLPHRMELVGERNGVRFVNDSKATNAESAAPALAAFDRIHWILGGQAKSASLAAAAKNFGNVVHAYTIGDAAETFAAALAGQVPVTVSGTLDAALRAAVGNAEPGDTVLLSPAAASFDQFRDFEDRGETFRRLVTAL
ncbi:UDP-N-acetylmuramoyl-L-alanine--D-glutamate ligase [Sphingomonas sp.]|uniref:UDP-N-acetylmuramoyl-L-alanine--D-glutamate ligase n=1 Tax=Sphingomonas sp. TaxID=28214 RepID=UPI0025E1AB78|nr:UDP-N-acetylmuramoyl-L-alanine--D-glutamate ligase [Sphingomonas sp.]